MYSTKIIIYSKFQRNPIERMCGESTYAKSYLRNDCCVRGESMKPKISVVFEKTPFSNKTIYKQSYLPSAVDKPELIIPHNAIKMPDQRMACDTNYNVLDKNCLLSILNHQ